VVNHGNNDDEFSEHPTEDDAISEMISLSASMSMGKKHLLVG
jgi:hypothetical protein